jgi:hypothetical protein
MSYSDYKDLRELEKKVSLKYQMVELFKEIQAIEPSDFLRHALAIAKILPSTFSEKARSENLITPILFEVFDICEEQMTIFSGCTLNIDANLSGICDYVIAAKARLLVLDYPLVCIIEAKNRSIEEGLAQAGAEMLAAHLFNQAENYAPQPIYGAVTNGIEWRFLKLESQNLLLIDTNLYYSTDNNLKTLLGIFQHILKQEKK